METGQWLQPTPSNLGNIAEQYSDISGLPPHSMAQTPRTTIFYHPTGSLELGGRSLRVIIAPHTFPIDAWMAGLDVEATTIHGEVSHQFAPPSLNNQFSIILKSKTDVTSAVLRVLALTLCNSHSHVFYLEVCTKTRPIESGRYAEHIRLLGGKHFP
jgi:hypothetical protein